MRYQNLILVVIFLIITFIFIKPVFDNGLHTLGDGIDHDISYMYSGGFLRSLEAGQIPFWNPWFCGGTVIFAHPHIHMFSPLSVMDIFVGEGLGLKLRLFMALFVGAMGAYLLARKLGIGKYASFIPAAIFAYNGGVVHTQMGGMSWALAFIFFPFILLYFIKIITEKEKK